MEDIKVDDNWQLTRAANGDVPITGSSEELLQSIKLEAVTQEGDLFYDADYGWSLLDFLHSTDSGITRTAIQERIRRKMSNRTNVDITSLQVNLEFREDILLINIIFKEKDNDDRYVLKVTLDRVRVEVTAE